MNIASNKLIYSIIAVTIIVAAAVFYYIHFFALPQEQKVETKTFHIGVVRTSPSLDDAWTGFQKGMSNRGYGEGKNVTYIVTQSGSDQVASQKDIEGFVRSRVDLIYVMGVAASNAAKEVTAKEDPGLPVVFSIVSDPVGNGLVQSIKSSGNNLTGVTPAAATTISKRLELTKEMVPGLKRVIFPWNNPKTTGIEGLRSAAQSLGIILVEKQVKNTDELAAFLDSFSFLQGDALIRPTDSVAAASFSKFVSVAIAKKVPLIGTNAADVRGGALMSYGADYEKAGEQAARQADAILKGARPSDLPIEFPEKFELVINLKTADAIGLTIAPDFLAKADRVIGR